MKFTKLEATGNDFVLVEARGQERDWAALAQKMCHRHFGVGADGLLVLGPSKRATLSMRVFNADGSEAEVTGNGLRCLARYAIEAGLAPAGRLSVETKAGIKEVLPSLEKGRVVSARVDMGTPRLRPRDIPALLELDITPVLDYPLKIGRSELALTLVSMGNPHAVAFLKDIDRFPLGQVGPRVEHHPLFPQRINFEIARVLDRQHVRARVWERGVGETLSSGTGAAAIAVAAHLKGLTGDKVEIELPGGVLALSWDGKGPVLLEGPVERVFEGEWPEGK